MEAKSVVITGKNLKCNFCSNDKFYELKVKVNTFETTFLTGFCSLLAKSAKAYICSVCGKKEEFVTEK